VFILEHHFASKSFTAVREAFSNTQGIQANVSTVLNISSISFHCVCNQMGFTVLTLFPTLMKRYGCEGMGVVFPAFFCEKYICLNNLYFGILWWIV
jgi:hypothetical protein